MKMKFLGKRVLLALGVVALSLGITSSSAQAGFSIADLIAGTYTGPTLTGFDVLVVNGPSTIDFTNFNQVGSSGGGAIAPTNTDVLVHGVPPGSPDGNSGLLFNAAVWVAGTNQFVDSFITYEVNVLRGPKITDLHLYLNSGITGTGTATVDDTFFGSPGNVLASPGHAAGPLANAGLNVDHVNKSDGLFLAGGGVSHIFVQKDVNVAGNANGSARISAVFQTYSVPEPASFALVGLGLLGTGFAAYRRRKMTV